MNTFFLSKKFLIVSYVAHETAALGACPMILGSNPLWNPLMPSSWNMVLMVEATSTYLIFFLSFNKWHDFFKWLIFAAVWSSIPIFLRIFPKENWFAKRCRCLVEVLYTRFLDLFRFFAIENEQFSLLVHDLKWQFWVWSRVLMLSSGIVIKEATEAKIEKMFTKFKKLQLINFFDKINIYCGTW